MTYEDTHMSILLRLQRRKPSTSRKLPILPRFGFYLDIAGYEMTYKQVPILESVINLIERGWPPSQLYKIYKEQLAEIQFPIFKKAKIINVSFRNISAEGKK